MAAPAGAADRPPEVPPARRSPCREERACTGYSNESRALAVSAMTVRRTGGSPRVDALGVDGRPFQVEEARDGDRVVLAVRGEIDMATAGILREAIAGAERSRA